MFRSKAEQKVADAGYDPARLPPGQYLTEKWPVLHAGSVPETDLATWDFRVFGEVEEPRHARAGTSSRRCRAREITIDIHCVTRWSRFDTSFRGVALAELAKLVQPKPSARFVVAHAEQGFTANVPLAALEDEHALIAYEADGEPLDARARLAAAARHPEPVLLEERQVAARASSCSPTDQPGFWERYGYHNDADYWKEERYEF